MNLTVLLLLILGVFAVIFALSLPLGFYVCSVFDGSLTARFAWMQKVEAVFLFPLGKAGREPMSWVEYCMSLVVFTVIGAVFAYLVFRFQNLLPMNPLDLPGLPPDLAFNTAMSFASSTTWQAYTGEATMSLFSQSACLSVLMFLTSGVGMVAAIAFARGLVQNREPRLGNAWVDLVRYMLWLMLPITAVLALVFVWQGSVQTFDPSITLTTLEGAKQQIAVGPVASQEALRLMAVQGGGFYGANSAHPFATPSALICLIQIVQMLIVSGALVFAYGRMTGNLREGFSILSGMTVLFIVAFFLIACSESGYNPLVIAQGVSQGAGNMEGKEVRFGTLLSSLFATTTEASGAGSAAGSFESMLPLGGGISMWLIQAGDVIFGGSRSGLYTILGLAIVAVFVLGMLVGRSPRYIGKKIDAFDMKMVCVALLVPSICTLIGTAVACMVPSAVDSVSTPGPQGFMEILFAFSSVSNLNGSAMGGLDVNTPFYNTALSICMWIARIFAMTALLAVAGNMGAKPRQMNSSIGISTDGPVFSFVFIMVAVFISVITFFPAQSLGWVVQAIQLYWDGLG